MPQAKYAVIRCREQLLAGQRLHRDLPDRSRTAWFVEQHVPENTQGFAKATVLHGGIVAEVPLVLLGRLERDRRGVETG